MSKLNFDFDIYFIFWGSLSLFLAYSVIFIFHLRQSRFFRFLPIALVLCTFLIELIPEPRWFFIYDKGPRTIILLIFSLAYFPLAVKLWHGSNFSRWFALICLLTGISTLGMTILDLNQIWVLQHAHLE
jgi:hypothetical protein